MNDDDISKIARQIEMMRDDTAEFVEEFAMLSDEQLHEMAGKQADIAAFAEYRRHAAETEMRLRAIRAALADPLMSEAP
ncbi:hypothetical protein [Pukyongiella litopenaei]|uniref:Uncharacterized protein n=1 Tax=Pukyongiella litopenaei TaxID=2605946 RepID=A0A2S0MLR2_9RHOB|nr:hypothetical protein [Pukyongiella litopenaei]AVO36623.1 hypothetical protein C6Y53_02190 [Pukyongiella litopenaei]